ncbi:Cell division protein FtsQ [Levilactobacillus brevis]|nr:Cell division protein FtsQ [Levilactobacillus brevis]
MKFRLNRQESKQQRSLTPWEQYQEQAKQKRRQQQRQARTPKWFHQAKRIGDKLPRLKHQRNRQLVRRLTILLTSFTVVILAMVYLVSPLSHLQRVRVTGAHALSVRQIQTATGVLPGDSIFNVMGHEKKLQQQALQRNSRLKKSRSSFIYSITRPFGSQNM